MTITPNDKFVVIKNKETGYDRVAAFRRAATEMRDLLLSADDFDHCDQRSCDRQNLNLHKTTYRARGLWTGRQRNMRLAYEFLEAAGKPQIRIRASAADIDAYSEIQIPLRLDWSNYCPPASPPTRVAAVLNKLLGATERQIYADRSDPDFAELVDRICGLGRTLCTMHGVHLPISESAMVDAHFGNPFALPDIDIFDVIHGHARPFAQLPNGAWEMMLRALPEAFEIEKTVSGPRTLYRVCALSGLFSMPGPISAADMLRHAREMGRPRHAPLVA